jgi:hypothetical protein
MRRYLAMSDYELREGAGFIFKNKDKRFDKHPDYKGKLKYNGETIYFAVWEKEGKYGKYFSMSVDRKQMPRDVTPGVSPEFNDDVPF